MAKKSKKKARALLFRVFADDEGKVFLAFESGSQPVAVERPVTSKTLEAAKQRIFDIEIPLSQAQLAAKAQGLSPKRIEANQEIEAALDPIRKGRWLSKMEYGLSYLFIRGSTVVASLMLISIAYKGVQFSSENFWEPLHVLVLFLYVLGLGFLIFLIGSEENRLKYRKKIMFHLGPRGMLVLPFLLLGTAGSVMASITFRLHNRGLIALDMCSGRPMSEAGLMDFYMWHFINIVPLLQINKLLRWGEPYCYTQSRVGFLILAFQLFVVIPSFNTIRFYWKHRKTPSEYVYDPDWNPAPE